MTPEEVSLCDILAHLAPGIEPSLLMEGFQREAAKRKQHLERLRRQILAGSYHVSAGAVAAAILEDGGLFPQ